MVLLLAAMLWASPARAADQGESAVGATQRERAALTVQGWLPCVDRRELGLCSSEGEATDSFSWSMPSEVDGPPSRLILFTRLAGMFMGRVDAVSVGSYRLRFKLTLR